MIPPRDAFGAFDAFARGLDWTTAHFQPGGSTMPIPYADLKQGDAVRLTFPDGTIETFHASGSWSSFGVAWSCAVALDGERCPVLFYSDFPQGYIRTGYTLRRDNGESMPTFTPVSLSTGV